MSTRRFAAGLVLFASCVTGPCLGAQTAPDGGAMLADVRSIEVDSNDGRTAAFIRIFEELGLRYERQTFEIEPIDGYPRTTGTNLVITLGEGPSDIVVGAHYDAVWLADGTLGLGAVDNAASSVILTRVAEQFRDRTLGHRLRVVLFDMEEIGLRGSAAYVRDNRDRRIAAAINLDVNGYGDTLFYGPTEPEGNSVIHRAVEGVCAGAAFDCMVFARYPQSDYISFQRAGIPNVSLSVLPKAEAVELHTALNGTEAQVQALGGPPAILRLIHTSGDRSDRIEPGGMAITYEAVVGLVERLDSALE